MIERQKVFHPGIEPGTYRVLGGRHNQLDQWNSTDNNWIAFINLFFKNFECIGEKFFVHV